MTPAEIARHCAVAAVEAGGEARRLLHGRGRNYPGLEQVCIDWYPPVLQITFFREPDAAFARALCDELLLGLSASGVGALVVQRRDVHGAPVQLVHGALPARPQAREAGLDYRIEPGRGQNLGFFLDMRMAREWLRQRAGGKSVLNLFAFTCAFSVVARAAGATRVVNIDMSSASLATGRENHRDNGLSIDDIHFLDHDVFRSWNKLHRLGRYDLVVMDPPTAQKGSFSAEKDYGKVVRRFSKLLKAESDVLACLNATHLGEDFLDGVFARELPGAERVERLANPPEFADLDAQAALKVVHYRYRRPADLPPLEGGADTDD